MGTALGTSRAAYYACVRSRDVRAIAAGKLNPDFDRIRADPRFVALVGDAGAG